MAENSNHRGRQTRHNDLSSKGCNDKNNPASQIVLRRSPRLSNLKAPIISSSVDEGAIHPQEAAIHQPSGIDSDKVKGKQLCPAKEKSEESQQEWRSYYWGKPSTILSWLIDSKTVEENGEVIITAKWWNNHDTIISKKGLIKRAGIQCCCCRRTFTVEAFYVHSGETSDQQNPYHRIVIAGTRKSLLNRMKETWDNFNERQLRETNFNIGADVVGAHDDACIICANGRDLLHCDCCRLAYHQHCMDIAEVPTGSWYCPYCVCKFCGENNDLDFGSKCYQCGKKYHLNCRQEWEQTEIDLNIVCHSLFCGQSCMEVYVKLEKTMIGIKHELGDGYSWTLVRQFDHQHGVYVDNYGRTICHSKLAVARRLMENFFTSLIDPCTTMDTVKSVIYDCSSNSNRQNYKGFYLAVLERWDQVVCVAALRIHDIVLAENHFMATHIDHEGQGMWIKLLVAIEAELHQLGVKKLVISLGWKNKQHVVKSIILGFHVLDDATRQQLMNYNTLTFPGNVKLYKSLTPP